MKIEYHFLPAPISLEEFAEKYNLTMVVNERKDNTFYANFDGAEIKDGGCLISSYGKGDSPEEAIEDYKDQIKGKILVFNAFSNKRREIDVPGELIYSKE